MRRPLPKRGFAITQWMEVAWLDDARWTLSHYWKRIVALTLLGLGASALYLHWNPDSYVSKAEVRFIPPKLADRYVIPNVAMQVDQGERLPTDSTADPDSARIVTAPAGRWTKDLTSARRASARSGPAPRRWDSRLLLRRPLLLFPKRTRRSPLACARSPRNGRREVAAG